LSASSSSSSLKRDARPAPALFAIGTGRRAGGTRNSELPSSAGASAELSFTVLGAENCRAAAVNCDESAELRTSSNDDRIMPPLCNAFCRFFNWMSRCCANMRARLLVSTPNPPALPNAASSSSSTSSIRMLLLLPAWLLYLAAPSRFGLRSLRLNPLSSSSASKNIV